MQVEKNGMILFWQNDSIYSNWYEDDDLKIRTADGLEYDHSEGLFIALKAKTFGTGPEILREISKMSPYHAKRFGRAGIPNFDEKVWEQKRYWCMIEAVQAKFEQCQRLKDALIATYPNEIVEASPVDKVWGIGLAPDDERALNRKNWRGLNLLGKALMHIRHQFWINDFEGN
jgi:ribA/ribD-fused uncharacterized protein